jgi:hypothetical protein
MLRQMILNQYFIPDITTIILSFSGPNKKWQKYNKKMLNLHFKHPFNPDIYLNNARELIRILNNSDALTTYLDRHEMMTQAVCAEITDIRPEGDFYIWGYFYNRHILNLL